MKLFLERFGFNFMVILVAAGCGVDELWYQSERCFLNFVQLDYIIEVQLNRSTCEYNALNSV